MANHRLPGQKRKEFFSSIKKKIPLLLYDWFGDVPIKFKQFVERIIKSPPIQIFKLLAYVFPNILRILILTSFIFLFLGAFAQILLEELLQTSIKIWQLYLLVNIPIITIVILYIIIKWVRLSYDINAVKRDLRNIVFWNYYTK